MLHWQRGKKTMSSLSIFPECLLLSVFLLSLIRPDPAPAQISPTDTAQSQDGPRAAIESYFKAHALGKAEFITQAFTPEAKIQFVEGDQRKEWTRATNLRRDSSNLQRTNIAGCAALRGWTLAAQRPVPYSL
jgi:hypothetical protein